ncbi:hypothetical protein J2T17_004399 [Paenibacillus mucilaginosus]|uniref:hypothetical protein n=1 Tax=Paenibacillus mucilaginosus TaxID=61624 RepID=UPI003D1DDC9A
MYLNSILAGRTEEKPKSLAVTRPRKERSDKIKDVKIPLTAEEWGTLQRLKLKYPKDWTLTDMYTKLLVDAIVQARQLPDAFPEVKYKASSNFITCKPTVLHHDMLKDLCVQWNLRSLRKAAYRLMAQVIKENRL